MPSDAFTKGFGETFKGAFSTAQTAAESRISERIKKQAEKAEKETKLANLQSLGVKQVEQVNSLNVDDKIKQFLNEQVAIGSEIKDPDLLESHFKSVNTFMGDVVKKSVAEQDPIESRIQAWQKILDSAEDDATANIATQNINKLANQSMGVSNDLNLSTTPENINQPKRQQQTSTNIPINNTNIGSSNLPRQERIKAAGQAESQGVKAAELSGRQTGKAASALDTSFDATIEFDVEQYKNFGLKPGDFIGLAAKLTPKQANKFKSAALAAGKESAGQVGKQILPSARGVNLLSVFAKSSAELGNTVEGNAENVAFTYGNLFANSLEDNIMEIEESTGREAPIQDIAIDPISGKRLSELSNANRTKAIIAMKRDFIRKTSDNYLMNVFKRDMRLLKPETRADIIATLPNYESEEEGNTKLPKGEYYTIGNQLAISEGLEEGDE